MTHAILNFDIRPQRFMIRDIPVNSDRIITVRGCLELNLDLSN